MRATRRSKGPFLHRLLVLSLGGLLTLLFVWLLGFILLDIGRWEGPDYAAIEDEFITAQEQTELAGLVSDRETIEVKITVQRENQELLHNSTANSQATMNQLLDIHRLNLQKDIKPTPEAQSALAESERLFLQNQGKYQEANQEITRLSQEKRRLEKQIQDKQKELEKKRGPAREEYRIQKRSHDLEVAAAKLALLLPLFLLSGGLAIKKKRSPYRTIIFAALVATSWKVGTVMHEHFPTEIFKYLLIGVGIIIVLAALVKMIRMVTAPALDWMLQQYKEAYQRHRCPICSDPIRRGPFRHATWKRNGPIPATATRSAGDGADGNETYICPSCGTRLFETCDSCRSTRHSLLPYCDSCGAEKDLTPERIA
jgi:predicted RNA-binding Zn-ribbon protein involved in translation (DUF1610 family)